MEYTTTTKEVYYQLWCPKCEYHSKPENDDPCEDCLTQSFNEDSHKPVCFKEATK